MKRTPIFMVLMLASACAEGPELAPELDADADADADGEASFRSGLGEVSLTCAVEPIAKRDASDPSRVRVRLVNAGEAAVEVAARNLPFANPEREYFAVRYGDERVEFRGVRVKLADVSEGDLVSLAPGQALESSYAISDYYHLDRAGKLELELLRPSVEVLGPDGIERLPIACPSVTLAVAEPEPEPKPIVEPEANAKAGTKFVDCTSGQQTTLNRADAVVAWMLRIARGVNTYGRNQVASNSKFYADWFGSYTSGRAADVSAALADITLGLSKGPKYKCKPDDASLCEGAIAYTIPFWGDSVRLCAGFWSLREVGINTKWGVLLHEFSHVYAGTDDVEYGWWDNLDLAVDDPDEAVDNADSYQCFMEDIYLALAPRHDVGGDGRGDLVTTAAGNAYVYPGTANSTFAGYTASFSGTLDSALWDDAGHHLVEVADMNRDGYDDLFTVRTNGVGYSYFGSASGSFSTGVVSAGIDNGGPIDLIYADGVGYELVGLADTDGDLSLDLVTIRHDGAVCWFGGAYNSNGGFSGSRSCMVNLIDSAFLDGVGEHAIDLADVDGDRRADIVTSGGDGTVRVYRGTSGGTFMAGVASFAGTYNLALYDGSGHEPVAVADVTGDGRADLVTHYHQNGSTYVYPGQANGSFGAGVPSFAGTMDSSLFDGYGHELIGVFDVDGNGLADLVTRHSNGNAYVYRGTMTGQFSSGGVSFSGTLDSGRHDQIGHEFATERRQHRRRGCAPTGCL